MLNLAIAAWLTAAYHNDTVGSYGWERWTREQWLDFSPCLPLWMRDADLHARIIASHYPTE